MTTLTELWRKAERWVVYGLFFVFVLVEGLSGPIPAIHSVVGPHGELVLLGLALLGAFRLLDERFPETRHATGLIAHSFGDAVKQTIGPRASLQDLDIYAHTGSKYCDFVRDNKVRIERLRLLICSTNKVAEHVQHELELTIRNWKRLQSDGLVGSMEIRYYQFLPSFHFMIADKRRAQFGLFRYTDGGFRILKTFVFGSTDLSGNQFIEDLAEFFDTIFFQFSQDKKITGSV